MFGHDEIIWGNHLTNFEADHGEVIGLYGAKKVESLKTVQQIAEDWKTRHEHKTQ